MHIHIQPTQPARFISVPITTLTRKGGHRAGSNRSSNQAGGDECQRSGGHVSRDEDDYKAPEVLYRRTGEGEGDVRQDGTAEDDVHLAVAPGSQLV